MSDKILVLGPTGNVGYPLVHLLKKHNANFSIGLKPNTVLPESMKNIDSVTIDYNNLATAKAAFTHIKTLFILIPDSPLMVDQTRNINKAILSSKIERYVYLSGAGAKVAPDTWLSQNLLECEHILRSNKLPGVILRPTFYMQNFINHYPPRGDNGMYLPIEAGVINYVDVNDVAAAACEVLTKEATYKNSNVFHLTGRKSFNMYEIAKLLSKKLKRHYTYFPISEEDSMKAMERANSPKWLINMLHQIFKKVQQNLYAFYRPDLQFITEREPIDFNTFIEKNHSFFNKASLKTNY